MSKVPKEIREALKKETYRSSSIRSCTQIATSC
ncbi:hypothetical protein HKBW3S25_01555, partial [Candidatus Hakubella thermalkaliphila]